MNHEKTLLDEITEYIKNNLKKGYTKESLKWALIDQGYSRIEVEKALKRVDKQLAEDAPKLQTKPKISYELVEPSRQTIGQPENKSWWKKIFG